LLFYIFALKTYLRYKAKNKQNSILLFEVDQKFRRWARF